MTGAMRAVLLAGLLALLMPPAFAQDADALFDEGVEFWERGRVAESLAKFREVLAADPSSEAAYQMLQRADYELFLKMLAEGGEAQQVARRLLDLSRPARSEKRRDDAAITQLVDQAVHGADFGVRRKAQLTLQAEHGEYAVPALVRYLGSNDIEERTNAVVALTMLGGEAVLPLIEVLNSDNVEAVRNACGVLARLKDQRAIPSLMAIHEAEGADEIAAKMAGEALGSIGFDKGFEPANAYDAYLHLAGRYYRKDPGVIVNFGAEWTLWSWKDGGLVSRQVQRFLYGYELAEEAAFDALALVPGDFDARVQIALCAFAEQAEVDAFGPGVSGDTLAALKAKLAGVTSLAASQGVEVLDAAALRAMSWGDTGVARVAMMALTDAWGDSVPTDESALVQGLRSDDKGIRYAAATGLMMIAPAEEFPSMELVVPTLADAAAEGSHRQILVVEPNPEVRTFLLHELIAAGYYAVGADNGASCLLRARTYSVFDLIVLRSALPDITAIQVVKELKADFRTRDIPIVILTANAEAEMKLFAEAAAFIKDPMKPETYLADVKTAMTGSLNDDRAKALEVSLAAATALGNYSGSLYDISAASDALADTLTDKPDNIRLAALHALMRFGTAAVQAKVMDCYKSTANALEVRVAAAGALGGCLKGQAPAAETFDAVLAGMAAEEVALKIACGGALGKMDLTPEQRAQVLGARRID